MSTENVDIVVNERGAQQAGKNIHGIGTEADFAAARMESFTKIMETARRAVELLGLGVGAKEVLDYADSHARLQNQIAQTVNSTKELTQVEEALFHMSQETRTSFATNVDQYKALKESLRDFGVSSDQVTQMLRVMNQVMIADGGSSEDLAGGMRMLNMALSTGVVEGRGLHALLLQFPDLGRLIASELHITTKQLNDMGMAGQLTSQQLVRVLTSTTAAARAQAAFAQVNVTVKQALTVLNNAIEDFIGKADQAHGLTAMLAQAILTVSRYLPQIATALFQVGAAFAAIKVVEWGTQLAVAFAKGVAGALRLAASLLFLLGPEEAAAAGMTVLTGGFNLLIPAIGMAIAWTLQFGQATKLTEDGSISLRGVLVGTWNYVIDAISRAYTAIVAWFQTSALGKAMVNILELIGRGIANIADWAVRALVALGLMSNDGQGELSKLKSSILEASKDTKEMERTFVEAGPQIVHALGSAGNSVADFQKQFATTTNAVKQDTSAMSSYLDGVSNSFNQVATAADNAATASTKFALAKGQSAYGGSTKAGGVFVSGKVTSHDLNPGSGFRTGGSFDVGHPMSVAHFASGADFMVGGNGGTDSQLVQFYASPDERVTVQTPQQQRATQGGDARPTVVTVQMTVNAQDVNSFNKSRKTTVMALQSELQRALRSMSN